MENKFKRPMRKAIDKKGKLKEYQISLGVNTPINEERFYLNDKGKSVCDVIICFPDELEKILEEHEEFQSQIQSLKETIEEKEKELDILGNRLSHIEEEHEKELKNIRLQNKGQIDELKEDIKKKSIENNEAKIESEKRIGDLKGKYEKQIGDLKEKTQRDLNKLTLYDEGIHMSIIDHQKEISDLKDKHQEELNGLKLFDEEKHMKISDHNEKVNGLKDSIVRETIQYNDNLNELKESLSLTGYILGKHKSIIADMESEIEELKLIAKYEDFEKEAFIENVNGGDDHDSASPQR